MGCCVMFFLRNTVHNKLALANLQRCLAGSEDAGLWVTCYRNDDVGFNKTVASQPYLNEIPRCCHYPLNEDNILTDAIILKLEAARFFRVDGQCKAPRDCRRGRNRGANLYGGRHFEEHYIPNRWPPE
jgi:hypothetical protein